MSMRAPKNSATGTSGQSFVKGEFEELGWGAVLNPEHDLGTDIWLMARDSQRWDLGVLGGAQVKTGVAKYFDGQEERDEHGNIIGWWYYEADDSHFTYWVKHASAHFIILRNPEEKISYWAHVTADAIVSTGKGNKILVPRSQIVNEENREALTAAVTSVTAAAGWDGSAWNADQVVLESDLLRHALLTPRLVAPHPNANRGTPTAAQAIAAVIAMHTHALEQVMSQEARSGVDDLVSPGAWSWAFFDALVAYVDRDETSPLFALSIVGCTAPERAALACARALASRETGDIRGAREWAHKERSSNQHTPVDAGWLQLHEAWAALELGDFETALPLALSVQQLRVSHPSDPTAMAIAGGATSLVFNASAWGERDVAQLIQSSDTAARLWRSQTLTSGLGRHFEEGFKSWGGSSETTFARADFALNSLRSASLMAGLTPDPDAWRYGSSLFARRILMTAATDDAEVVVPAIQLLLRTGPEKDASLVVRRLVKRGPVSGLRSIAQSLKLDDLPRTAILAVLRFLRYAGDLLDEETADSHAIWLISALNDPERFARRFRPTFLIEPALIEAVGGLMLAVSDSIRNDVIQHVIDLPVIDDQYLAGRYGRLLARLPDAHVSPEAIERLLARSGDNFELQDVVTRLAASRDTDLRRSLLDRISSGDFMALNAYGNVTELPIDVAAQAISHASAAVRSRTADARASSFGFGGVDAGHILVLLNAWHPEVADWSALEESWQEPASSPEHLVGGLSMLSRLAAQLPDATKEKIRPALGAVSVRAPTGVLPSFGASDARPAATAALTSLFPQEVAPERLRRLLAGGIEGRRTAAQVIAGAPSEAGLDLLVLLANDSDLDVQVAAAEALATFVSDGVAVDSSASLLAQMVSSPGTIFARRTAAALTGTPRSEARDHLLRRLVDHPCAVVRTQVEIALSQDSGDAEGDVY